MIEILIKKEENETDEEFRVRYWAIFRAERLGEIIDKLKNVEKEFRRIDKHMNIQNELSILNDGQAELRMSAREIEALNERISNRSYKLQNIVWKENEEKEKEYLAELNKELHAKYAEKTGLKEHTISKIEMKKDVGRRIINEK